MLQSIGQISISTNKEQQLEINVQQKQTVTESRVA